MGRILALLPWCVLAVFAWLVWSEYPHLPDRWAVHFDLQGRPNGWMPKSLGALFFPLIVATIMCALFEIIAQFGVTKNSQLSARAQEHMANFNRHMLRGTGVAVAAFMGYLAWRMPTAPNGSFIWPPLILFVTSVVVVPVVFFLSTLRSIKGELPPGYNMLFYSNPADARVWVPKLSGMGSTLNFAHKAAWVWMAALLALPLGILSLVALGALAR